MLVLSRRPGLRPAHFPPRRPQSPDPSAGAQVYDGTWEAGQFHGAGVYHLGNGDRFLGGFSRGNPTRGLFLRAGAYAEADFDGSLDIHQQWRAAPPPRRPKQVPAARPAAPRRDPGKIRRSRRPPRSRIRRL